MILHFKVGNYRSINEPVILSMEAETRISDQKSENTFELNGHQILKAAAIYGANASGKSNIVKALSFMTSFLLNSSKESQMGEPIPTEPFVLDSESAQKPSLFELVFIMNKIKYRYGLEVDEERVHKEWLFQTKQKAEKPLFIREMDAIECFSKFKEGAGLESKTRENALFVSVVANFAGPLSGEILDYMKKLTIVPDAINRFPFIFMGFLRTNLYQKKVIELIKLLDLGIKNLSIEEEDDTELDRPQNKMSEIHVLENIETKTKKTLRLYSKHNTYKDKEVLGSLDFEVSHSESEGTKKLISIAGFIVAAIENGSVLIVDELEAKLHPILTRYLIKIFHNPEVNKKNAQIIFTTHDTNLLQYVKFRRDQIWFTEKNNAEETSLYSLSEIKPSVRKDASLEKDYFQGRFGAIPYLGDLDLLCKDTENISINGSQNG